MTYNQMEKAQGLYRPEFEHDACGIGLYAHIKGIASHDIVKKGLSMLCQLDHRGGQGSDPLTGDGSGLMVQLPDQFFRKEISEFQLPDQGEYAVGMIFFSQDEVERKEIEAQINKYIEETGEILLGWRTVPTDVRKIGIVAQKSCPTVRQVFIQKNAFHTNKLAFERKLYIIRKQAENWGRNNEKEFYCASLSSSTIVYKGLLTSDQVETFYLDLQNPAFKSAFSIVHSRFSTNTFPSWERAHPNRYLIHNGEINTLRGNINWMKAREQQFASEAFGSDLSSVLPILDANGSDSSVFDNALEFFILSGRTPAHAAMMMIPEPWTENPHVSDEKRAFYEYHSSLMEPWDGPMAITFTDGKQIGAILDRNGLRPARYYVTKDDYIVFSSEVGVIPVEENNVLYKERLSPGKMLLIDLEEGRIISDEELKNQIATEQPYQEWLDQVITLEDTTEQEERLEDFFTRQKAFGYTYEDVQKNLLPVVLEGKDPIGSMGNDTPLAVLSDKPQSLFNYFKQLFAQVTNPPIDAIREQLVTSTLSWLGREGDLLHPNEKNCHRIQLKSPILKNSELEQLRSNTLSGFSTRTLDILFRDNLKESLRELVEQAEDAIHHGVSLLILSDRGMSKNNKAIPVLLAVSALHQELTSKGLRTKASIIVESGEVREVHHFASLIGFGADAINPYLVYATYLHAIEEEILPLNYDEAVTRFNAVITEGVVKVMSKMGISTVQSYRGAQIFEAVGIGEEVINEYFTGTVSQLGGIGLDTIAKEASVRHELAYVESIDQTLDSGSEFQWRKGGEHHAFNPKTIHTLQWACRKGDYSLFKQYSTAANEESLSFIRNLFSFNSSRQAIDISEVESVESIVKRFKTGAMSFGSLSKEAHETLAIAMNRLGASSNSGEGGEDPNRYLIDENGDNRRSNIKQIASGRFGVKSHYLINAKELQIKMAQGAKPGEGGQLPGNKVYPWVADVRGSTPGVGLISPPPHHDIYSIEDLAQLIHDLKNANKEARISVKLVSKGGIGTIAAGVAKGAADVIVVSGYDGGTGASPKTSIKHTGLPWELGLAEAHQTLMLNGLRSRVVLETDGKLMTGKDVVLACLLGAEEFGFATAPLIVMGCVMMRACHLDTCPVGIATQNPELRYKFAGDPQHVVHFMQFIAEEVRELMAQLGFRTVEEMVGRTDVLGVSERAQTHWKASSLDLSKLLHQMNGPRTYQTAQNHKIAESMDMTKILPAVESAIENGKSVDLYYHIKNTNRVTGTIVGSEISKKYGEAGLPEDTINLHFSGSAGQSFGAFIPKGMSLYLTGDANDYIGKGLSGGKIVAKATINDTFVAKDNVIIGNVAFYGATDGEAFINGKAGERFAVRNSGASIVVEGIGDHGLEYMTGGEVVILGEVGKNFAAGMSGGVAYVLSSQVEEVKNLSNKEMIMFETLEDRAEIERIKGLLQKHIDNTDSMVARQVLANWDKYISRFIKVIPKDYKRMISSIQNGLSKGLTEEDAVMQAFETNSKQDKKKQTSKLTVAVQ